jgi:hypothetical protein
VCKEKRVTGQFADKYKTENDMLVDSKLNMEDYWIDKYIVKN